MRSSLHMPEAEQQGFNGVCWLRCRLVSDSTVSNLPLAITMFQQGASEVFLDGRPLDSFGHIGADAKTSRYYDPNEEPFYFNVVTPGEHVLAVRYANYHAARNLRKYGQETAGFEIRLSSAKLGAYDYRESQSDGLIMSAFLFGLFLTLFILHLLLYAYNRRRGAHLLFAFMAASLSAFRCSCTRRCSPTIRILPTSPRRIYSC